MSTYRGYPQYVVIAMPKCGTKTMYKCFSSLGFKVFDAMHINDHANAFDDYGTKKIDFAQFAEQIWEKNEYDVIIEPAGLYWLEMAAHWPKTKFIQLCRDVESWEKSACNFLRAIMPESIPHGAILNQVFYENEHISPTAHHALRKGLEPYPLYIAGHGPSFFNKNAVFEQQEPWERMLSRKYRLFHADVQLNAPKDRTLFNYNVKDGWPPLRKFLQIADTGDDTFPHETSSGTVLK